MRTSLRELVESRHGADAAHMRLSLVITVTLIAGGLCGSAQADRPMGADQAAAVARAINLASGDLPGYTRSPHATTAEARGATNRGCCAVLERSRAAAHWPI
jgi:hypothetical protein